jgi:predicted RNA-binding Zn-ribbon protein involved in translation (DUF1610 family)
MENDFEAQCADARRALVYVPCPACGRAVELSEENRAEGARTYECPNCGARFYRTDS